MIVDPWISVAVRYKFELGWRNNFQKQSFVTKVSGTIKFRGGKTQTL